MKAVSLNKPGFNVGKMLDLAEQRNKLMDEYRAEHAAGNTAKATEILIRLAEVQ